MSYKDDGLSADERDAISADLLLKKLREGLEQQSSKKDEQEKTQPEAAQISEETMKLAQSEILYGEVEEFDNDEIDEQKIRAIINLPEPEIEETVEEPVPEDAKTEEEQPVLQEDKFVEISLEEYEALVANLDDSESDELEEYEEDLGLDDSDPWYENEEEALAKTLEFLSNSDIPDFADNNASDEIESDDMASSDEKEPEEDEIDDGFLTKVAAMVENEPAAEPIPDIDDDMIGELEAVDNATISELTEPNGDETLPPVTEDGSREYVGLNGTEYDSTELTLITLFKNKEEIEEDLGKERAEEIFKVGSELELPEVPKKKKFYELFVSDYEYKDTAQNDEIKSRYSSAFTGATVRFLLCLIFAGVLFVFENAGLFGITLPNLLNVSVYPTVCAMIDLQLVLICALMLIDKLAIGFVSLFKFKPTYESVPAVLLIVSVIYTMIITLLPGIRGAVFYNFPVALTFVMTLLYEIMNLKREVMSYDVASLAQKKYTVRRLTEEERAEDAQLFEEYVPAGSPMFAVTKTDFVDGFFGRVRNRGKNKRLPVIMLIVLAEMLLSIGLGILLKASAYETVTMAYLAVALGLPGTILIAGSHPFYRAVKAAFENESTIVGEGSLEEYSDGSVVFFDEKDIFPSTGVKINSVKVYGENRIDGVIYYAASIFAKTGGPLSDVFSLATLEIGHSENVEILECVGNGLHCTIDGESIYLGSNDYMKSMDFETPYGESDEAIEKNNGIRLMYIANELEILAKFYVQYSADLEYEIIFKQLYKAGMCVGIRSRDPNIDDAFVAKKLKLKSDYPMKVVHSKPGKAFSRKSERADSGIVSAGSVKSLLRTLSLCDRIKYIAKIHGIFELVSTVLVMLVIYAVAALGKLGLGSAYAALYQLFWLIPIMFVTMFTE